MRVLLDTCEFLWLITADPRLPRVVSDAARNQSNEVFLSVVSFWEICVKQGLGKLTLPAPAPTYIPLQRSRHGIVSMNLDEEAVAKVAELPAHHRDPFDRMLICQALTHGCHIATSDPAMRRYDVAFVS